jgi:hypothetical protein
MGKRWAEEKEGSDAYREVSRLSKFEFIGVHSRLGISTGVALDGSSDQAGKIS